MDPITILAGVQAASALAQWMNSEDARKASAAERKKISALYDKIQTPNYDISKITPEDFKVIGKYAPQAAPYIAEANPKLIEETADMATGRQAQLEALRGLRQAATAERDPALMAQLDLAAQRGQAEAQSRQASALLDAQRRGQGSSLGTLMAQMKGGAIAQNQAAEQSRQAAIAAYQNKLNALRSSADLGSSIRAQDIGLQGTNVNAINAFNQRTAANQQAYANQLADLQNEAQLKNLAARQSAADRNVGQRNEAAVQNLSRYNEIQSRMYNDALNKASGQAGTLGSAVQNYTQAAADRNQAIQGVGDIASAYYGSKAQEDLEKKKSQYAKTGIWPE